MSRPWRDLLHRSDRAMIYLFIAGSYTPWLQLRHLDGVSVELRYGVMGVMAVLNNVAVSRWAVWLLALLGITYQQLFHERYKALETLFYVIIATLPSLAVLEMVSFNKISYYFTIYILILRNKTCRYVCI